MKGFQIQVRSILSGIWYEDTSRFSERPQVTRAQTVSELRESIIEAADSRTLPFVMHVRVITDDGEAVERWKIRPGFAKRLRRRS